MFCDYKETVRKQHIIYEDEDYAAFLSNRPISKGHSILIPKNHIESFSEVLDAKGLLLLAESISDAITKAMEIDALNIQITCGDVVKKNMSHLHVHLIPMFEYPEGKVTHHIELTLTEMDEVAEKIKALL
jgi:histidine triad (HIT) family protein